MKTVPKSDLEQKIRNLEETLNRTENNLKAILDATTDGFMVIDENRNVLLSSKKVFENLGLSESPGISMQSGDFMKAAFSNIQEPELFLQKVDQINKSDDTNTDTFKLKNGNTIEWFTKPLMIDSVKKGRVWSYRNITENLKAAEAVKESEKRSVNIINRTPFGMHIYKVDDRNRLILIGANEAADRITGIKTDKLIGLPIHEAFPSADNELIDRYRKAALAGEIWERTDMQYEDERIKGAYDIFAFQIAQGEMAVMFQDITQRKQTEEKLRINEEKYRKIFQNITDIYFEITPGLNIREVSPSVSMISDYQREELIGKHLSDVIADEKIIDELLNLLLKKGYLHDFDVPLKDRDGRIIHCAANVMVEKDETGQPVHYVGTLRDITERKKTRDEILKLSGAVEQSPASIIITDTKGNIEYINPKFTQITGYTREEAVGQNPRILKSGYQNKSFYKELWNTITQGKEWRGEFHNKRKDGSTFWEMASISPIRNADGDITHYLGIKEDITARKRFETALREAKEKAEQSDKLKSAFLANMSHEIRTPMNAILGFSELLKSKNLSHEDQNEYINMISVKGNELMMIISDLIDISRIEAGDLKMVKTKFPVKPFLDELYDEFKTHKLMQIKQQIQFRKNYQNHTNPVLYSDNYRLKQVFSNLLSNALKFTNEGFIELGYDLNDDEIRFFVKDSGIGIDESKKEIIFERFVQADTSYSRRYGGTGLGLAISRQIIMMLGGKIRVESRENYGSSFYITLKISKENEDVLPEHDMLISPIIETPDFSNKRILIAEDDGSNYLYLESLLRKTNADLLWAKNGKQALDIFRNNPYIDLIIMDIRMPEMNGLEATEEIRKTNQKIPIIALTAFAFTDDKEKSLKSGCNEHISKPVKAGDLIMSLIKYLA